MKTLIGFTEVSSTVIEAAARLRVANDTEREVLVLRFRGPRYHAFLAPKATVTAFYEAGSKGQFLNAHLKSKHAGGRVAEGTVEAVVQALTPSVGPLRLTNLSPLQVRMPERTGPSLTDLQKLNPLAGVLAF